MRERWVDNFKGILIILVVLGHILPPPYAFLSTPASYIFVFHMPAFFIISGYLAHPKKNTLVGNLWGKVKRVLGPYFFYLLLLAGPRVLRAAIRQPKWIFVKKNLKNMFWGGQNLNAYFCGALWFLTCMFVAFVLFYLIEKIPRLWMKAIVYFLLWGLAHYHSHHIAEQNTFWLYDVAIIAVVYIGIGQHLKKYIMNKWVLLGSVICVTVFFVLHGLKLVPAWEYYGIELWSHTYRDPVLDFIVPCGIFVILANVIRLIPEGIISRFISDLGKYSLAIMAMHQMVMHIMIDKLHIYHIWVLTIVSTLIPYLIVKFIFAKIPGIRKIAY